MLMNMGKAHERVVAYFSMEIGLTAEIPTYSGGLGVLAGDTVRTAADLKIPMIAMTLVHRGGYFFQSLGPDGSQKEEPAHWSVDDFLSDTGVRVSVRIEGRDVLLRTWVLEVKGCSGHVVPVYFLDADLSENAQDDRDLTRSLYGGDLRYRLCQEVILGIGGLRALRALGHRSLTRFHMNEGHAALLTLELLEEETKAAGRAHIASEDFDAVRGKCVFTTHTPVPAGHDRFPLDLVNRVLGHKMVSEMKSTLCCGDELNMTYLGLNLSRYVNGVAKKHGEVSRHMFSSYSIDSITNGVHVASWTSKAFAALFDRYMPGWREDNYSLRYALNISSDEVRDAHMQVKRALIDYVNRHANAGMDVDVFTLGFARRSATYKRGALIFDDLDRLRSIVRSHGPVQIVFAGKAHPADEGGKEIIRRIFRAREALRGALNVAYVPNYDIKLGKLLTSGVDVWLNTPEPPMEASGTSGMKSAINGVPSLSILDGWWIEGCVEGVTGWAIGEPVPLDGSGGDRARDARALYDKLENVVLPMFYSDRERFAGIMLHAIALNGSFFNTQRMMHEYVLKAYFE